MSTLLFLGLAFVLFSYRFPVLPTVNIDILPDFIGFLLIYFSAEKLIKKSKWFKEVGTFSAIFAAIHFLGFIGDCRALFPQNTTFMDSDIFSFIFTGVGYIYENGALIFVSLAFVVFHFVCKALGDIAESENDGFMTWFCYIFSWVFLAIIPLYIVGVFVSFPFEVRYISYPISIIFAIVAIIFSNKHKIDE